MLRFFRSFDIFLLFVDNLVELKIKEKEANEMGGFAILGICVFLGAVGGALRFRHQRDSDGWPLGAMLGLLPGFVVGAMTVAYIADSLPVTTEWQLVKTEEILPLEDNYVYCLILDDSTECLFCRETDSGSFCGIFTEKPLAVIEEEGQAVVTTYGKRITSGDPGAWRWGFFTDRSDEYEYERRYEFHIPPGTMRDIKLE